MKQQTFRRIFREAAKIPAHAVIAGGAAVDFDRAWDIDVFVLGGIWTPQTLSLASQCDALLVALGGDAPAQDADTYINADDCRGQFYRCGRVSPDWSPLPIHVIGWRHDDPRKTTVVGLLETFDLSVHAWAVDETGKLIGCDNSTPIGKPISVAHETPTTPARLVKLSQRYSPGPTRTTDPNWRSPRG